MLGKYCFYFFKETFVADTLLSTQNIMASGSPFWSFITKTRLFYNIENFITKNRKFSDKNSDIFPISAQNIDCGYSLEPPR